MKKLKKRKIVSQAARKGGADKDAANVVTHAWNEISIADSVMLSRYVSASVKGCEPSRHYFLSTLSVSDLRRCVAAMRILSAEQAQGFKVGLVMGVWPETVRRFGELLMKDLRKTSTTTKSRRGRKQNSLKESTRTYLALFDALRSSEPQIKPRALLDRICKAMGLPEKAIPSIRAALKRQGRL